MRAGIQFCRKYIASYFVFYLMGFSLACKYVCHKETNYLSDYLCIMLGSSLCQNSNYLNEDLRLSALCENAIAFANQHEIHSDLRKIYTMKEWHFNDNTLISSFPLDKVQENYIRNVENCIFSKAYPTKLKSEPRLVVYSADVLSDMLDFDNSVNHDHNFIQFVSGNQILKDTTPLAHRYGGHQFGYWAGQLGDGRAHLLGVYKNHVGERWELQLKGSGKTPYSRRGDGYAVIRSSVREFLCSEAMYHLGIPTSRAATLVVSHDPVWRDQFYDGNLRKERAAIVLRLAKSWFRFGSIEILSEKGELSLLRYLVDFIIDKFFEDIHKEDKDKYIIFFSDVVENTAEMVARWQSVGFTHGVCNTDNFSILSITIDYGPFGFLEKYDPEFVPNTSDDEGRYSYAKQPEVGLFNLNKLKIAIEPLLSQDKRNQLDIVLLGYMDIYKNKYAKYFQEKLGLLGNVHDDDDIVNYLLHIMERTQVDFTMTFRNLGDWSIDDMENDIINHELWALNELAQDKLFKQWKALYLKRIKQIYDNDFDRQIKMQNINPRYILRNWIAEEAIRHTENDEFDYIRNLNKILESPFTTQPLAENLGYSMPPPYWAKNLKVSCSS